MMKGTKILFTGRNLIFLVLLSITFVACGSDPKPMKQQELDKDKIEKSFQELEQSNGGLTPAYEPIMRMRQKK